MEKVGHLGKVPEKSTKMKVLRMKFSILENVPTSDDIILVVFLALYRPYEEKTKNPICLLFY